MHPLTLWERAGVRVNRELQSLQKPIHKLRHHLARLPVMHPLTLTLSPKGRGNWIEVGIIRLFPKERGNWIEVSIIRLFPKGPGKWIEVGIFPSPQRAERTGSRIIPWFSPLSLPGRGPG